MVKNISVRETHAILIKYLGRLTFSLKTLANVPKLDALKKGIQYGELKSFFKYPQKTFVKIRY